MNPIRILCAALVLTLLGVGAGAFARRAADPVSTVSRVRPLAVLHAWDAARARAWAEGDPAALATLYTAGSRAGRSDQRLLGAYAARGLRVEGLAMQVLAARVIRQGPDVLALRVTDRVAGAAAVGHGTTTTLPRDEPTTHTVVLRLVGGAWRMAAVKD